MKTWVIVLLSLIFVFVVVPLIYFAIVAKTAVKIVNNDNIVENRNSLIK